MVQFAGFVTKKMPHTGTMVHAENQCEYGQNKYTTRSIVLRDRLFQELR